MNSSDRLDRKKKVRETWANIRYMGNIVILRDIENQRIFPSPPKGGVQGGKAPQ